MPETESQPLRLVIEPQQDDEEELGGVRRALVAHPRIRAEYSPNDLWMVNFDLVGKEEGDDAEFRAIMHDLAGGQVLEAAGWMGDPDAAVVVPTSRERRPSPEEFTWAVTELRKDPEVARRLDEGELVAYHPMPPLASEILPDGSAARAICVGLRDATGEPRHQVVAVRTEDAQLLRHVDIPVLAAPSDADCGAPIGPDCEPTVGPPRVRARVFRGDELLWDLMVVRPSASSGTNGSGVELRFVDYQRQRVLYRAHVPILNVEYGPGSGGCGPSYRDWVNEESCFGADGDDAAPGFRVCETAPRTILDTSTDEGDFRGVAFFLDGDELVIVSQLRAGWYRYVSEWRLHADGTIRPRFGFAAVANPCTCRPHTHHAYWRFDFDIVTADNNLVQEFNDPPAGGTLTPWQTVRYEVRRHRDPAHQRMWRVRGARSSLGYTIVPGPGDGTAGSYGMGDVWVLAFQPSEIDDGQGFTTDPVLSRAQIDRFVSGEQLSRADVVVWYAAHFAHEPSLHDPSAEPADGGEHGHQVGPELRPFNWRPPLEQERFAPLLPPTPDETIHPEVGLPK